MYRFILLLFSLFLVVVVTAVTAGKNKEQATEEDAVVQNRQTNQLLSKQVITVCDGRRAFAAKLKENKKPASTKSSSRPKRQRRSASDEEADNISPSSPKSSRIGSAISNLPERVADSVQAASKLQRKMLGGAKKVVASTGQVISALQEVKDTGVGSLARIAGEFQRSAAEAGAITSVGDGPFGKEIRRHVKKDPTFVASKNALENGDKGDNGKNGDKDENGDEDENSDKSGDGDKGGKNGKGGNGDKGGKKDKKNDADMDVGKSSIGDLHASKGDGSGVTESLARAQSIQILSVQSQLGSGIGQLELTTQLLGKVTAEIKQLQEEKEKAIGEQTERIEQAIETNTKESERLLGELDKTRTKLEQLQILTDGRLTTSVRDMANVAGNLIKLGDNFNQTYSSLSEKLNFTLTEMDNVKQWTDRAMRRIELHLVNTSDLVDRSRRMTEMIDSQLASFSANQLTMSALHIDAIQGKIDSISDKLDFAYNVSEDIKKGILDVKSGLDETHSFLSEAALRVDRQLVAVLTTEKRHRLLQTYRVVIARLLWFQNEFSKHVRFSTRRRNIVSSDAAINWAISVIDGDNGMSMEEVLFQLGNMITGKSIVFQRGSIMDWYMDAAQALLEKNPTLPSEKWYIERIASHLVTMQITGYTLLSTAHFILNDTFASAKTCIDMEQDLWQTDRTFALYIAAASPKMRHPKMEEAQVSDTGRQLAAVELMSTGNNWSFTSLGKNVKGELLTCGFCKGCDRTFSDQVLSVQCKFKYKGSKPGTSEIRHLPASERHFRGTFRGTMNYTRNSDGAFQIPFVAGMIRVVKPDETTICGVFLSQRVKTKAVSLGVHICDRENGTVIGIDNGTSEANPIPNLVLRDGTADDGSQNQVIKNADAVMTSWTGLRNEGHVTEIGLNVEKKGNRGRKSSRVLILSISSSV